MMLNLVRRAEPSIAEILAPEQPPDQVPMFSSRNSNLPHAVFVFVFVFGVFCYLSWGERA
jgi:hypothetical protein